MKKTKKTEFTFTTSYGKTLSNIDVDYIYTNLDYNRIIPKCNNRINKCQAHFSDKMTVQVVTPDYEIKYFDIYYIISYQTLVGCYFPEYNLLIHFGRYSKTTYQHMRKFRDNYTANSYYTKEYNMEYTNWF